MTLLPVLSRLVRFCACLALCCCLCPVGAGAVETHNVGFRTLGYWGGENGIRLDINVWYPTIRREKDLQFASWSIRAAHNGKPVEGRFPLIVVSHASPGMRYSYHDTCYSLASLGFVVAAPTHPRDCMDNMDLLYTWPQLATRARELGAAIDVLLDDRDISNSIDANRIGLLGFGSGGAAALLLGGALPTCDGWAGYCDTVPQGGAYCNTWARARMDKLCTQLPLKQSLANTRFKAIAVAQPAFGMLFTGDAFRYFYPPLLIMAAERERISGYGRHAEAIARALGGKARYVRLKGADLGSLMAVCPDNLMDDLPELCRSVKPKERQAIHDAMHDALGDFFLKYLGNSDNLPHIPEPPDLTPAAVKEDKPQPAGKAKQPERRRARPAARERR